LLTINSHNFNGQCKSSKMHLYYDFINAVSTWKEYNTIYLLIETGWANKVGIIFYYNPNIFLSS